MAEGDAVEEPQRFVMLRIRRLLDCELSGAQVHVKITLTSHCAVSGVTLAYVTYITNISYIGIPLITGTDITSIASVTPIPAHVS